MLFTLAALATPLEIAPFTLDSDRVTWSETFVFDGASTLTLDVEHPVLDERSTLTLLVDGRPHTRLSLSGTAVPQNIPLGTLHGRHQLTLQSDLRDPDAEDCTPGNPWLNLTGTVDAERPTLPITPPDLRAALAGEALNLQGGSDVLWLEAATWLNRWGASLNGDAMSVHLTDAQTRSIDYRDGVVEISGDATFLRQLAEPELLERCRNWPCHFPAGPLTPSAPSPTLGDNGYPRGLTLTSTSQQQLVLPTNGPVKEAELWLDVRITEQPLSPRSTLSVMLEDQPLATWSLTRFDHSTQRLKVTIPSWAHGLDPLPLRIEADLHGVEETCEGTARAPWVSIDPASQLRSSPADADGLAGDATRIRSLTTANLCLTAPLGLGGAEILSSLRPRGGWTENCSEPDVVLTAEPAGTNLFEGDPVAASADAWTVVSGAPVVLHAPKQDAAVRSLPWTMLDADRVVSTSRGWSAVGMEALPTFLEEADVLSTDAEEHRGIVDLLFGMVFVVLVLAGAAWVWRSRGDRSGWTEPTHG